MRHLSQFIIIILYIFFSDTSYSQRFARDNWQKPELIMDTIGVKPGMIIGEAGAGDGYFTLKLAHRVGQRGKIYANDINERALKQLKKECELQELKNVDIIVGKTEDPLFPVTNLDMVIMVYVFHDLEKPASFIKNIKPYLKQGAPLVIVERDPERYGHQYSHFMKKNDVLEKINSAQYKAAQVHTFLPRDNIYICYPE